MFDQKVTIVNEIKTGSLLLFFFYLNLCFAGPLPGVVGVIGLVRPSSSIPPLPTNSTTPVTFLYLVYFNTSKLSKKLDSSYLVEGINVLFNH